MSVGVSRREECRIDSLAGRIQGPGGEVQTVASKHERRALQVLGYAGGDVVEYPILLKAVWGNEASARNRDNVHHLAARLRQIPELNRRLKPRRATGYYLEVDGVRCDLLEIGRDLTRVEQHLAHGRPDLARALTVKWRLDIGGGEFLAHHAGVLTLVRRALVLQGKAVAACGDADAVDAVLEQAARVGPRMLAAVSTAIASSPMAGGRRLMAVGGAAETEGRREIDGFSTVQAKAVQSAELAAAYRHGYYTGADPQGQRTLDIAQLHLEEALHLDPTCLLALRTRLRVLCDIGDHPLMIRAAIDGVVSSGGAVRAWVALAEALSESGLAEEASLILGSVIR